MKPRLLDLFCGAGGCSVGYHRAGFEVVGVDIKPHPDYPFPITIADAMDVLADTDYLRTFDVIHASPPCPRYSVATPAGNRASHPDLVPPVRRILADLGIPYVIENVPGAPMPNAVTVCGWAMGLRHIRRHRLFESNLFIMSPGCGCPNGDTVSIFGHSGEDRRRVSLAMHGTKRMHVPIAEVKVLMGVEWMTSRDDVSDAIPPAYTEFIGAQVIDQITAGAAA